MKATGGGGRRVVEWSERAEREPVGQSGVGCGEGAGGQRAKFLLNVVDQSNPVRMSGARVCLRV